MIFSLIRLGAFGAVFLQGVQHQTDRTVFASRPGLRLWIASTNGTVNATYMFKELLKQTTEYIELLPDTVGSLSHPKQEDKQFGPLLIYKVCLYISLTMLCNI